MAIAKPALGKGLGALIGRPAGIAAAPAAQAQVVTPPGESVRRVPLAEVMPSPLQPRKDCAGDQLTINGRVVAPIAKFDREGRALPQWRECRVLRRDEYFVFSNRIPNSFDSRYYGPVAQSEVIGTFRPLWTQTAL